MHASVSALFQMMKHRGQWPVERTCIVSRIKNDFSTKYTYMYSIVIILYPQRLNSPCGCVFCVAGYIQGMGHYHGRCSRCPGWGRSRRQWRVTHSRRLTKLVSSSTRRHLSSLSNLSTGGSCSSAHRSGLRQKISFLFQHRVTGLLRCFLSSLN